MADFDWLAAASDPRVVAVVLARVTGVEYRRRPPFPGESAARSLMEGLAVAGITATEDQARALLDAVAAWDGLDCPDPCPIQHSERARLDAAVSAIVGEQP